MNDNKIMEAVLLKAKESLVNKESPFAAAIVVNGEIAINEGNHTRMTGNPLLHAEMVAIQKFSERFGNTSFENAHIYCSCEPCIMCFAAIQMVGIKRIVFGASINDAIKFDSGDIDMKISNLRDQLQLDLQIIPNLMRDEFVALFTEFIDKYGRL